MKVRLVRPTRVLLQAGETVEVPEAVANFLVETRSAEHVVEPPIEKAATKAKPQKGKGK